jgi:hypothetical protein
MTGITRSTRGWLRKIKGADAVGRRRLGDQDGFTMLIALGVLLVTSLLIAAMYSAVQSDVPLAARDLAAKQAYYAARAGMNAYLHNLNQDPTHYWVTCANDSQAKIGVPGSTTLQSYSYKPILANGSTICADGQPISSLIDTPTGTLTMQFQGYVGSNPVVTSGIVASFKMESPLNYLWYTKYESLDSSINGYTDCAVFYRAGRATHCNINWASGDAVNGPMYTQDQYLVPVGSTPTFGSSIADSIASMAPGTSQTPDNICAGNNCNSAQINGTQLPGQNILNIPSTNLALAATASSYGLSLSGTTTITFNGPTATAAATATVVTCTTATSCSYPTGFANGIVNLGQRPIVYASNAPCYAATSYTPFGSTYPQVASGTYKGAYYGCAGDVYVSGYYSASATIAAANDIVIAGNLTTDPGGTALPTGGAMVGLVANDFVRVQHGVSGRSGSTSGACGNQGGTDIATQTHANLVVDAAILNLQNSFIVDNYDCGSLLGNLYVNGSIVQNFRGAVGTSGSGGSGYLKQYNYDRRLANLLPPYLFDISAAPWDVVRETLCVPNGTVPATACQ